MTRKIKDTTQYDAPVTVLAPSANMHPATKQYVDAQSWGIDNRGKVDTFSRSAGLSIPTANAVFIDGWSKASGDAGITMAGSHVFFLPTGRWQITYGVVSDSAASSGLYLYMRIGEWFGTMVSPWETRSYLEATTGAGAGQIINTATFVVDSYALHDTMDMLGQANSGGGRSAYSGTMQFMRLR